MQSLCLLAVLLAAVPWRSAGTEDWEELERLVSKQNAELREEIAAMSDDLDAREAQLRERELAAAESAERLGGRRLADFAALATCLDTMWILICGALVMFMQAGFAFLEAGSVRSKCSGIVLLKNVMDVTIGTLMWWILGYGIAYGTPSNFQHVASAVNQTDSKAVGSYGFVGYNFITQDAGGAYTGTRHALDWFFQWAFCATSATIVSGAIAERIRMPAYIIYSTFMSGIIYPFVVYWTWSGSGFLTVDWNYTDFAGSGIVHLTGGIGALIGACAVGPRSQRFEKPEEFVPGNMGSCVLGTLILWFGWYGFNCGSTLTFSDPATALSAAQVAMNTTCAAAAGGCTVFILRIYSAQGDKYYDLGGMCNGVLAGLVAVCAGVDAVESGIAVLIGVLGALAYEVGHHVLIKLKIDDPLDAFSVHGLGGLTGVLTRGVITPTADGAIMKGNFVGALVIIAWSGGWSLLIFGILRLTGQLRVPEEEEHEGGDKSLAHVPSGR